MAQLQTFGHRDENGQLGSPDGLFNSDGHAPISVDDMSAYRAFLAGLPWVEMALARPRCTQTPNALSARGVPIDAP